MLDIVNNEYNAVNGLGDSSDKQNIDSDKGVSGDGSVINNINETLKTAGDVAANIISASNSGKNNYSNGGYNYNNGYNTVPVNTNSKDYLPWIIGGCAVLLLFGMMVMNNKK